MKARRPIVVLPDELANQIAAGEVVERPASIVKELCENSIDARASRVDVEIEGGGVARVAVIDDGDGIPAAELETALIRHATSKISTVEDLTHIGSFGFRGEALPSIASVSRFEMSSRPRDAQEGRKLTNQGGQRVEPCGMAVGTRVEVRELFYNVPARLKFLRSLATESAHISEVLDGIALANPGVTLSLHRDGRKVREYLRASDREERVRQVLSGWQLIRCHGQLGPLTLEAFLSPPERARVGANSLWLFVNGRPVNDRALARSIAHAYGSVLEPGRYPVGVVYLDLPFELVDVNVHPQKAEVRFADGRAVQGAAHRLIERGLASALSGQAGFTTAPTIEPAAGRASLFERPSSLELVSAKPQFEGSGSLPDNAIRELASTLYAPRANEPAAEVTLAEGDTAMPKSLGFLAQLKGMFLLCEAEDALIILDQHAAAERVTFDRLKREYASRTVAQQVLLVPEVIEASAEDLSTAEELRETCLAMGVDVRAIGPGRLGVFAVPQILARRDPRVLATRLLAELGRKSGRDFSQAVDLALATMACHGSIRAGEIVAPEVARELLSALTKIDFAGHCPHGRPILCRLPLRDLRQRVGR